MDMIIDNVESPEVEPDLALRAELEKKGAEELFFEYQKLDPIGAEKIDRKNKRRLVRALEVCKKTGRPFSAQRQKGEGKYNALWLGTGGQYIGTHHGASLNDRIDRRVDEMINQGLIDEVRSLIKKFGCDIYSMSGIGYREFCNYPVRRGEWLFAPDEINDIIEQIKIHTRQYAKRQMTWFKRNKKIHWIKNFDGADDLVGGFL
jgi:tRNA dimethylallyltransferase